MSGGELEEGGAHAKQMFGSARLTIICQEPGTALASRVCMNMQVTHGMAGTAVDEIAELAGRFRQLPRAEALRRIEAEIGSATAEARWEDVGKWHRVRFRLIRLAGP
jgi:hypothetical protein